MRCSYRRGAGGSMCQAGALACKPRRHRRVTGSPESYTSGWSLSWPLRCTACAPAGAGGRHRRLPGCPRATLTIPAPPCRTLRPLSSASRPDHLDLSSSRSRGPRPCCCPQAAAMSGQASACVESELRAAVAALRSGDADAAIDALHRSLDVGTSAVRRERPLITPPCCK